MASASPDVLRYRGDHVVLSGRAPEGPGTLLCFDLTGEGVFATRVTAAEDGRYVLALDPNRLPDGGRLSWYALPPDTDRPAASQTLVLEREAGGNPAACVPENQADGEPGICTCTACGPRGTLDGASLKGYTHSYTPALRGVELATGKRRMMLPITRFATRLLGFDLSLHHATRVGYDGPYGRGFSHSYHMMIVDDGDGAARIITPDLRSYTATRRDDGTWKLPCGFFARLTRDDTTRRWTLAHFSGLTVTFFQGAPGRPGLPLSIREPNGNTTRLAYDTAGRLTGITTDLGQQQSFFYGEDGRLARFADHLSRTWRFGYDAGRLTRISTPTTPYADVAACEEVTEETLAQAWVKQPRTTLLDYADDRFPSHPTALTDARGATPFRWDYDADGRVAAMHVNGWPIGFDYAPDDAPDRLDAGNTLTRTTDRAGYACDWEIHGAGGGPREGRGRFGLRRKLEYTARGMGRTPLRSNEPDHWETRWLHDCHCLAPAVATQSFRSDADPHTDDDGIPTALPRTVFTYNHFRQVTEEAYTDGTDTIRTRRSYQEGAHGDDGLFSRLTAWTDPREDDARALYDGLAFIHSADYDACGNRTRHTLPEVSRGVERPQEAAERWDYNGFGQEVAHTDANGNITTWDYHEGPSAGGDINTAGTFGGYRAATTAGAKGSADDVTALTTRYRVNALGMVVEETDPRGFTYRTTYNDLQERTAWTEPEVTLLGGTVAIYMQHHLYDGAGYEVLSRRFNTGCDGQPRGNAWTDVARTFDAVGNQLSERIEVDANAGNDLVHRYFYDFRDDRVGQQRPRGNRTLWVFDERRLPYKTFTGVAPGAGPSDGSPSDPTAEDLGSTGFVALTIDTHDARGNPIRSVDGRGNTTRRFFGFYNRQVAEADPNGNGWACIYDDASHRIAIARGCVDPETGRLTQVLERTALRHDARGRHYLTVRLIDPERTGTEDVPDPTGEDDARTRTAYDAGGRITREEDANGNATIHAYDAAGRRTASTDALGNRREMAYDENGNLTELLEIEVPSPSDDGEEERYLHTFVYDEIDRRVEVHDRGRDGTVDCRFLAGYDARGNRCLLIDAEGKTVRTTFDDANRPVRTERLDGNLVNGDAPLLLHIECRYDRNGNKTAEAVRADVHDPESTRVTRMLYDDLDRMVARIEPDATDEDDRTLVVYDANSNAVRTLDPRGVTIRTDFDAGNRPVLQRLDLVADVPGIARRGFAYDCLDRPIRLANDCACVELSFDAFSRVLAETQAVRLDGSGFERGWAEPIQVASRYDPQSNRIGYSVLAGRNADLRVTSAFDALNRPTRLAAQYFDGASRPIAETRYHGPVRVATQTLGNGARLQVRYDAKRRPEDHSWTGPAGLLVGFGYGYDEMDHPRFERFHHDARTTDHFRYNGRFELTGVTYRSEADQAPQHPDVVYHYNDAADRVQACGRTAFLGGGGRVDSYASNAAGEYTQIIRDGFTFTPRTDRAGNLTVLPTLPVAEGRGVDARARARWDGFNRLADLDTGVHPRQQYCYDPLHRRVATLEARQNGTVTSGRRFIYDALDVVEERTLAPGTDPGAGTATTLERITVFGGLDQPLLVALDTDGDGALGHDDRKNAPGTDQEYFLLANRQGSIMALLDADNADRILEYYRYTAFGEMAVLPAVDTNRDDKEDSRRDLTDNLARAQGASAFGNIYGFTARRFDAKTGLYYYRNRYYEPRMGRFISRDPAGSIYDITYQAGRANPYQYASNNPTSFTDPLGLWQWQWWFKKISRYLPASQKLGRLGGITKFTMYTWGLKLWLRWDVWAPGTILVGEGGKIVVSTGSLGLSTPITASVGVTILIGVGAAAAGVGLGYGLGTGTELLLTPDQPRPGANPPAAPGTSRRACSTSATPTQRQLENTSWGCKRSLVHAQQQAQDKCARVHSCTGTCPGSGKACTGSSVVSNTLQQTWYAAGCTTYLYYSCDCSC